MYKFNFLNQKSINYNYINLFLSHNFIFYLLLIILLGCTLPRELKAGDFYG